MKKIIQIISLLLMILILSSCGSSDTQEGGSLASLQINNNTTTSVRVEVVNCDGTGSGNETNDCLNYTCIKEGDTLISNNDNTLLEIIHSSNNTKKVCVKNTVPLGSATIIR